MKTCNRIVTLLIAIAAASLGGCIVVPPAEDWSAAEPAPQPDPPPPDGSIYHAGSDRPLFENQTARRVGDLLTIRLAERTSASKSATTSTSKKTDVTVPAPIIGGQPISINGTPFLDTTLGSEKKFDGQGDSAQSNSLQGSITVTVAARLANGNLLVRGEKWLALNQGKEFVRVQGIVRPVDVEPDNSVPSWKVADARISYGGRGAVADSNAMGWIARFFNSPVMPF